MMNRWIPFLLLICCACSTPSEKAAQDLARRIVPDYYGRISFVQTTDSNDVFEVIPDGKKLVIKGNNAGSMAVGLNWYLQNVCLSTVSWDADEPVEVPSTMPLPDSAVRIKALVPRRFFLNYCTFGYSMPWWGWKEWERLIDWMALNGINEPLSITGQEAVWQDVWRRHGMTDAEIRSYFTGPAYLPWHRMCNIDGVDAPLPQGWIDAQVKLQKRILKRERSFGMRPVLPAFSGHVPARLKELYPSAIITDVSAWGGFPAENLCHFLSPSDSLYAVIQKEFLESQTRLFGTDHIYGFDLFNEVDAPSWDPETLAGIARNAYGSVAAVDPEAEWLQMGWLFHYDRKHWTPENIKAYLQAVPQGKVTLLDYYTEHTPVWTFTEGFYGQPYIFCYLGNFGGNTRLAGPFRTESERITAALQEGGAAGIGATLEGFGVNMPLYEYILTRAWDTGMDDDTWIEQLADRRFGEVEAPTRNAWKSLMDSIYVHGAISQGVLPCDRPGLEEWNSWRVISKTWWDQGTLLRIWEQLLAHPSDRRTYTYDVINIGCQVLGDHFSTLRDRFAEAYRKGDLAGATAIGEDMKALLADIDRLASFEPSFRMDRWLRDAVSFAQTPAEKDYYRHNAWHIVTTWGGDGRLRDYASRLWNGLVSSYYAPRWEMFIDEVTACLREGRAFDQAALNARIDGFEEALLAESPMLDPPAEGSAAEGRSFAQALHDRWFPQLTLISYNVGAFGKYTENSIPEVAQVLEEADFAGLQELDSCNRRHGIYQLEVLSKELGQREFTFAAAFPFAGGAYGNGIVSKETIETSDIIPLPKLGGSEPRSVAVAESRRAVFATTHLDYADPAAAKAQAALINDWFSKHYDKYKKPVFLCGDMNALPDSPTLAELEKVWERLTPAEPSYPSGAPAKCIDYIFRLRSAKPVRVLEAGVLQSHAATDLTTSSDHLPVRVVVRY